VFPPPQLRERALRFCFLFAALIALFSLCFEVFQDLFTAAYLHPIAWAAATLLNLLGFPVHLDTLHLAAGFCDLLVDGSVYRIIHECTGVFGLLVYSALVLAYPASARHKAQGLVLGLPAFYLYSTLRLVVIGLVAHYTPQQVEFFHQYMMVLINLGFLFFLWLYWLERVIHEK